MGSSTHPVTSKSDSKEINSYFKGNNVAREDTSVSVHDNVAGETKANTAATSTAERGGDETEVSYITVTLNRPKNRPRKTPVSQVWGMDLIRVLEQDPDGERSSRVSVVVERVHSDPALSAGIKENDAIVALYGAPFATSRQLYAVMSHSDSVMLTVKRVLPDDLASPDCSEDYKQAQGAKQRRCSQQVHEIEGLVARSVPADKGQIGTNTPSNQSLVDREAVTSNGGFDIACSKADRQVGLTKSNGGHKQGMERSAVANKKQRQQTQRFAVPHRRHRSIEQPNVGLVQHASPVLDGTSDQSSVLESLNMAKVLPYVAHKTQVFYLTTKDLTNAWQVVDRSDQRKKHEKHNASHAEKKEEKVPPQYIHIETGIIVRDFWLMPHILEQSSYAGGDTLDHIDGVLDDNTVEGDDREDELQVDVYTSCASANHTKNLGQVNREVEHYRTKQEGRLLRGIIDGVKRELRDETSLWHQVRTEIISEKKDIATGACAGSKRDGGPEGRVGGKKQRLGQRDPATVTDVQSQPVSVSVPESRGSADNSAKPTSQAAANAAFASSVFWRQEEAKIPHDGSTLLTSYAIQTERNDRDSSVAATVSPVVFPEDKNLWATRPSIFATRDQTPSGNHESWIQMYEQLKEYRNEHGHCRVPANYPPNRQLGKWISTQRTSYKQYLEGKSSCLTKDLIDLLDSVGLRLEVDAIGGVDSVDRFEAPLSKSSSPVPTGSECRKQLELEQAKDSVIDLTSSFSDSEGIEKAPEHLRRSLAGEDGQSKARNRPSCSIGDQIVESSKKARGRELGSMADSTSTRNNTSRFKDKGNFRAGESHDGAADNSLNIAPNPSHPNVLASLDKPCRVKAVKSTSSKAGITSLARTKIKRIWPDSSIFAKRIMKWTPPNPVEESGCGLVRFKGMVLDGTRLVAGKGNECLSSEAARTTTSQWRTPPTLDDIPDSFADAFGMLKSFTPHLFEEAVTALNDDFAATHADRKGFWSSRVHRMQLYSVTPVDPKFVQSRNLPPTKTFEFGYRVDIQNAEGKASGFPTRSTGELFVIHSSSWKSTKAVMGIIGSDDINTLFLNDQKVDKAEAWSLFKVWICVAGTVAGQQQGDTGWLPQSDMPAISPDGTVERQTMHIMSIGNVINFLREYQGLKGVASLKGHLQRTIFCDRSLNDLETPRAERDLEQKDSACKALTASPLLTSSVEQIPKPSSLSGEVWNHLQRSLNPLQLAVVEKAISGKAKENVLLLQGPPGTGKSQTVLGIVTALLNAPCPQPGGKVSGTKIKVGNSLSSSAGPNDKMDSPITSRILVCAPSNTAVDDLAWRIHQSCIRLSGQGSNFKIARFGVLPGVERNEGKRKVTHCSFASNERDQFLHRVNVDLMVENAVKRKLGNVSDSEGSSHIVKTTYSKERRSLLSQCQVVCTTLNSAGSKSFIDAVTREDSHASTISSGEASEFDALIIDEACQASEPSSLIPFKFNPDLVVLTGDPRQIPVLVRSKVASEGNLGRSLFERLQGCGWPVDMLKVQYRMHEEIMLFPSNHFYEGQLLCSSSIMNRLPAPWHKHPCFPPFLLWNVRDGKMSRNKVGGTSNHNELLFIIRRILNEFRKCFACIKKLDIGIITFYSEQVTRIKSALNQFMWAKVSIQVSTVDGFQGAEKDIVILSCVRSNNQPVWKMNRNTDIGFLKDYRRVNVAMTRARQSLWVVGHCETLVSDPVWKKFIDSASSRNLIAESSCFDRLAGNAGGQSRRRSREPRTKCNAHGRAKHQWRKKHQSKYDATTRG